MAAAAKDTRGLNQYLLNINISFSVLIMLGE
jgi:hypothetical protein